MESDTTATDWVADQAAPPGLPSERTQELDPLGLRNRSQLAQAFREAPGKGIMPFVKLVCKHESAYTPLRGAVLT